MKVRKKSWRLAPLLALVLMLGMCLPVLAASDDNSLSSLNIHNGTLSRDFQYDIWEYDVTVEPGTTELFLEPQTSDPNASVTSITGTVLQDGEATVLINTVSESGVPMTYTLHVKESGEAVAETEAPETEAPETQSPETQAETAVTEVQTETEEEAVATNALQDQVAKLKSNSDLMMKILYGMIALCVILLFCIINLILKNHDLKDDLKDAQDQLAYQTNEFARKERMMVTDNYYAPNPPGAVMQPGTAPVTGVQNIPESVQTPVYTPSQHSAPAVEEAFGTRVAQGGYQGMQPEDVPPNRPITEEVSPQPSVPEVPVTAAQQPTAEARMEAMGQQVPEMQQGQILSAEEPGNADVNITMVEL